MKDLQTKIKKFNFSKNKIKKNVLIIGSGRWSKITIEEINKNIKCVKIFFYTKKKYQLSDWSYKKKIKIIQIFKLEEIKTYNITHAIVINKNKDHFNYTKKLLKMKVKTLVEKPIVENLSQFNKLYNISKKKKVNLLVSLPFFNALYFHYFKKFTFSLLIFGIYMPIISALIGMILCFIIDVDVGTTLLFTVLCSSASYIAVPAAMRLALPEAKAGIYIPMSLAITFPFNIILGIPIYYFIICIYFK